MIEFVRRYRITIGYAASVEPSGDPERREFSFVAEDVCEDDAIWTALTAFRREEVQTWDGWPRDVLSVVVERGTDD